MELSQIWDSAHKLETHHLAGLRLSCLSGWQPGSQGATAPWCLRAGYELVHEQEEHLATICTRLFIGGLFQALRFIGASKISFHPLAF